MTTFTNNDVSPGDVVQASDHNTQGSLLAAVLNGGIDNNNINASAAIATSKLADDAGITTAKIADSAITGAKISTYKIVRQDNTSNSTESTARILTGWGVITNNTGASSISETVTFDSAFTNKPIVLIICGGDHATTTNYGDGGNNIEARIIAKAHTITTSGFTAQLVTESSGNNFGSGSSFYQWIAIGV